MQRGLRGKLVKRVKRGKTCHRVIQMQSGLQGAGNIDAKFRIIIEGRKERHNGERHSGVEGDGSGEGDHCTGEVEGGKGSGMADADWVMGDEIGGKDNGYGV